MKANLGFFRYLDLLRQHPSLSQNLYISPYLKRFWVFCTRSSCCVWHVIMLLRRLNMQQFSNVWTTQSRSLRTAVWYACSVHHGEVYNNSVVLATNVPWHSFATEKGVISNTTSKTFSFCHKCRMVVLVPPIDGTRDGTGEPCLPLTAVKALHTLKLLVYNAECKAVLTG